MSIAIIATIYSKSKHIGYRLLDTDKRITSDVTYASVKSYLESKKPILNAELKAGKIMGINCSLSDLSRLDHDKKKLIGGEKYLILERTASNQFLCTNYGGKIVPIAERDIQTYNEMGRMANILPLIDTYSRVYQLKNKTKSNTNTGESMVKAADNFTNRILSDEEKRKIEEFREKERIDKASKLASEGKMNEAMDVMASAESEKKINDALLKGKPQTSSNESILNNVLKPKDNNEPKSKAVENKDLASEIVDSLPKTILDIDFDKLGHNNETVNGDNGSIRLGNAVVKPMIDIKNEDYTDKINELDPKTGFTINQKMARGALVVKNIKIFYYSLYASLKKVPVEDSKILGTVGVTLDTLYFNLDFVKSLTLAEMPFLFLHEIMHIALKHGLRDKGRNKELFNIAADLYINKYIADEYGCYPGSGVVKLKNDKFNNGIEFASGGLFSPDIDVDKESVEKIYEQLMEELEQNQKKSSSEESGESGEGAGESISLGNGKTVKITDITYKGKSIGKVLQKDLMDKKGDENLSPEQKQDKMNGVIQRAITTTKLAGEAMDGAIERQILHELAPKVKWQTLLRLYLAKSTQKVTTYAKPDKRFLGRHKILPGPKPMEPDSLAGIKICADTSGSISDRDLGIALAQVKQILDTYKADAEMIYWDTSVRSAGGFKNVRELLKVKPSGGGGTDINCVFEYFEDKRKCKVPPKVIVVFTDGYFGELDQKYCKKYGKDVIWVIPDTDRANFHKPCGKTAIFK